jgi:hypothetical protein
MIDGARFLTLFYLEKNEWKGTLLEGGFSVAHFPLKTIEENCSFGSKRMFSLDFSIKKEIKKLVPPKIYASCRISSRRKCRKTFAKEIPFENKDTRDVS